MKVKLLDLPTSELLDKIGAGNHKPGSGSAAALNSIVACKLILTVTELTLDKPKYKDTHIQCKKIQDDIRNNIGPELEFLFQEDSEQFDRTINKRTERNSAPNQKLKNQLDQESLKELVQSTELPIRIANLSLKLAEYSLFIFDNCFKSARGDSGVALNSSLASITGCISIVSLNLSSFPKNTWTEKIKRERNRIRKEFTALTEKNFKRMDILEAEAERKNELYAEINSIKNRLKGQLFLSNKDLERLATDLQNTLWKFKDLIWKTNQPTNPIGVLKPEKVIKLLKYAYKEVITMGVEGISTDEIAGQIDNSTDTITISKMYPLEVKNFTAAHEMAHALLHNDLVLHRDIPLDKPIETYDRPLKEKQADKLAAYFLLPDKRVREIFKIVFKVDRIVVNENSAYAIANCSLLELKKKIRNRRQLARHIAKSSFFNLTPHNPIHSIFNVSIEAMAIRLEELNLVEY